MIRHLVSWRFQEHLTEEQKGEYALSIKEKLEALCDVIEGLESMNVITKPLPSSTCEIMLESTLADQAALDAYIKHPDHQSAARFINEVTTGRNVLDFEVRG